MLTPDTPYASSLTLPRYVHILIYMLNLAAFSQASGVRTFVRASGREAGTGLTDRPTVSAQRVAAGAKTPGLGNAQRRPGRAIIRLQLLPGGAASLLATTAGRL